MSVALNGDISQIYLGRTKLKSIWVGDKLRYEGDIKPEPYLPNEYLYFKLYDSQEANIRIDKNWWGLSSGGNTALTYDESQISGWQTPTFEYSFDKEQWFTYTLGTNINLSLTGERIVYWRGNNSGSWFGGYNTTYEEPNGDTTSTYTHYHTLHLQFYITLGTVKSGGNLLSLRDKTLSDITTIPCNYCFTGLFQGCTNLLTPPVLSATNLKTGCYGGVYSYYYIISNSVLSYGLFDGCTSLVFPPNLPAITLAEYCYCGMFRGCKALREVPNLPATTLVTGCYCYGMLSDSLSLFGPVTHSFSGVGMFENCSNIEIPPELPATTLVNYCYCRMFSGCTKLKQTPTLSVTALTEGCYTRMFESCPGITVAPDLPATTLTNYCYLGMFSNTSITEAPVLRATVMTVGCYEYMFYCTKLVSPPVLSSTSLATSCYAYMFGGCTKLTSVPNLPATTVPGSAYGGMFSGCSAIETTPALRATTLGSSCYEDMFVSCLKLKSISTLPTTAFGTNSDCYTSMFSGSSVKASASSTSTCPYAYRVPSSGSASGDYITSDPKYFGHRVTYTMFDDASGADFTPAVDTTFYISVPSF